MSKRQNSYGPELIGQTFLSKKRCGSIPYNHIVTVVNFSDGLVGVSPSGYALTEEDFWKIVKPFSEEEMLHSLDDQNYMYLKLLKSVHDIDSAADAVTKHAIKHNIKNPSIKDYFHSKDIFYFVMSGKGYSKEETNRIFAENKNKYLILPEEQGVIEFNL